MERELWVEYGFLCGCFQVGREEIIENKKFSHPTTDSNVKKVTETVRNYHQLSVQKTEELNKSRQTLEIDPLKKKTGGET
jgi:hypothetical protein